MKEEPRRPNPDELLARIREQEHLPYHGNGQGDLRLYLGAAPGVGKTYAMLEEAHRLIEQGVDVAVGFVETHGRAATEGLVAGLDVIPRRTITYKGVDDRRDGYGRHPRPPPARGTRGRTRAYERARLAACQAL